MMEKSFLVLLAFSLLSTTLGWQDECYLELAPSLPLPIKCNVTSYHCDQITCSTRFSHEEITLTVDIDQWSDPMTAYVTLSVPKLQFDWSGTLQDGQKIEVPGFPLEIEGFPPGVDVSLQISLKKDNGTVHFKVDLVGSAGFTTKSYTVTLIEGKLPESAEPEVIVCFFGGRFRTLPAIYKALIVTGVATFLILVVLAAVYCCKRNRATTADQVKVKPPSYDEATSTNTKVPMQPLINEI